MLEFDDDIIRADEAPVGGEEGFTVQALFYIHTHTHTHADVGVFRLRTVVHELENTLTLL